MGNPPSTTFEAARAAWLADAHFRRLSPVTIREYGRISGALLNHLADSVRRTPTLDDLRPAVVRTWLNDRQPPLHPASVAGYVRSLRAFARWCGREYGIADPLAGLQPPRVEPTPVPIFTPDQLRTLLDGRSGTSPAPSPCWRRPACACRRRSLSASRTSTGRGWWCGAVRAVGRAASRSVRCWCGPPGACTTR